MEKKGAYIMLLFLFYADGFRWDPGGLRKEG